MRRGAYPVCPVCGSRTLLRCGVLLPKFLADMFDLIEHSGSRGVTVESLVGAFYFGKPTAAARQAVKVNICRINTHLEETDRRIRMVPPRIGGYRLITVAPRCVVKIGSAA
jgi:hypothetical protein